MHKNAKIKLQILLYRYKLNFKFLLLHTSIENYKWVR